MFADVLDGIKDEWLVYSVLLCISALWLFVYRFYNKIFSYSELRRSYAYKLKHEIWEHKYIGALEILLGSLKYIEDKKSYIFSIFAMTYTLFLFSLNWLLGGAGSLFDVNVLPEVDFFIFKALVCVLNFSIVVFSIRLVLALKSKCDDEEKAKISVRDELRNDYDKKRIKSYMKKMDRDFFWKGIEKEWLYILISACTAPVVWYFHTSNLVLSIHWFVLALFSPILTIQTALVFSVISIYGQSYLTPLLLFSIMASYIYFLIKIRRYFFGFLKNIITDFVNYSTDLQNRDEVEYRNISIMIFVSSSLFFLIIYYFWASYHNDGDHFSNVFWIVAFSLIFALVFSEVFAAIFFIVPIIIPISLLTLMSYVNIKHAFSSDSDCYIFEEEVVGFFAILVLIPMVNSMYDAISYYVSRRLIQHLVYIGPKTHNLFFWAFLHVFVDIFIATFLIAFLCLALLIVLGFYFKISIYAECGGFKGFDQLIAAMKNNPWGLDAAWVFIVLGTTLIPTIVHTFSSILALIRNIVPRCVRYKSIKFLRGGCVNDPVGMLIASSTFTFSLVGALIIVIMATYFFIVFIKWLVEYYIAIDLYNFISMVASFF